MWTNDFEVSNTTGFARALENVLFIGVVIEVQRDRGTICLDDPRPLNTVGPRFC